MYHARACGFEAELTAAEGEGLSVEADIFYGSNVDPVRLRNAHIAWMTTAEEWHLKLCNVAKHRVTLGESSSHTIKRREQERYFASCTRLTGKRCNQGTNIFDS